METYGQDDDNDYDEDSDVMIAYLTNHFLKDADLAPVGIVS